MPRRESELLEQLRQKTEVRAIQWEPTANSEEFVTAFRGDVSFTTSRYEDPNHYGESYKLIMRDSQNREMITITNHFPDPAVSASVERLYTVAKNAALKVDETLDSVLDDLRKVS